MSSEKKKSFVVYGDWAQHLDLLGDEELGKVFRALLLYFNTGEKPELTGGAAMAFSFMHAQLDRDMEKYELKCEKQRQNIAKRWNTGEQNKTQSAAKDEGSDTNAYQSIPNDTKNTDTDNDTETDTDTDTVTETETDTVTDTDTDSDTVTDTVNDTLTNTVNIYAGGAKKNRAMSSGASDGEKSPNIHSESLQVKRFNSFWLSYPKKKAKQAAWKSWQRINPTAQLYDRIMSSVERYKRSPDWTRDSGRYIPNPATWLNGGCWDDEIKEEKQYGANRQYFDEKPYGHIGERKYGCGTPEGFTSD